MVGHKRLILAVDKADKTREAIRKIIVDFFKDLGFKDDDIIFVDRKEFGEDKDGLDQVQYFVGLNNFLTIVLRIP